MQDEIGELIHRNYPMLRICLAYVNQSLCPKLLALYGLLATIEESLYRASDPVVSSAKLAWWYEELRRARDGNSTHPLSLQLQSSGALALWPEALIERMFKLAIERVEAAGVNDENSLHQLCESLGLVHLELELALQNISLPDQRANQKAVRRLAAINGLMQLFRESYQTRQPTYYWVPLSDCGRLGIERLQIVEKPFDTKVRQVFEGIVKRTLDRESRVPNLAFLKELPKSWAERSKHWLLLSMLQQRQLSLLQIKLAKPGFTGHTRDRWQQVRLGDGWFAWRIARQLNASVKVGNSGEDV